MNRLSVAAVVFLQFASPGLASERSTVFVVENMTCALCPITVERAMRKVDGVRDVSIDFKARTATVVFEESRTNAGAIAEASLNAGYPAAPAE